MQRLPIRFGKVSALNRNSCKGRESLIEVYNESQIPNWDGYGAQSVSFESFCRAEHFLKLLPSDLPLPNVSAHPDGEVAFEWRVPNRKILTISVGNHNFVTFAGVFGNTERYGVENFIDEIPQEIRTIFGKFFTE